MTRRARRLALRALRASVRRAVPVACLWLVATASGVQADTRCVSGDGIHIRKVCLETVPGAPVYGHGILGRTPEWNQVTVNWGGVRPARATTLAQAAHIFEDTAPRLVDLDGDGQSEIILVQSSFTNGSRLVVLRTSGQVSLVAATPYIGRARRWLAPVGVGDLDGDGAIEIAYVETPHLGKTLKVWRFTGGKLHLVAARGGLSNHQIGDSTISGGIRDCGQGPEMITADANWRRIMATRLVSGQLVARGLTAYSANNLRAVMGCKI